MVDSLEESNSTFSQGRVEKVFRDLSDAQLDKKISSEGLYVCNPADFGYPHWETKSTLQIPAEKQDGVRLWCIALHSQLKHDLDSDLEILDSAYSEVFKCKFLARSQEASTKIVQATCGLLKRLPAVAPEMRRLSAPESYAKLPNKFFTHDSTPKWETLRVARYVNSNIICAALQVQMRMQHLQLSDLYLFANLTMVLLAWATKLSKTNPSQEWFLIKLFLWTSWQRMATLVHYDYLCEILGSGWDVSRFKRPLDGMRTIRELSGGADVDLASQLPPYMCKWAFRLLRADQHYVGQDLRRLLERFSLTFRNHAPRCMKPPTEPSKSCDGIRPAQCSRLSGLAVENQSAHTTTCKKPCSRLYWNKNSWTNVGGRAAVLINSNDDGMLWYCEASAETMAVSHVWSHGQGGRPENDPSNEGTGLNSCLHKRFSKIAQFNGCTSYWMDTPCIPSNHNLRRKAILEINHIFTWSKLTLICDRDLMMIDITKGDMMMMESVLATLLLCDWQVRAWTLLEGLRARRNIHILCKDDHIIGLNQLLEIVLHRGCIDIAVAFLSARHLLRAAQLATNYKGLVSTEEAASLLSHRHASRPGDEIVIWGLLSGDEVFQTAEDFWQSNNVDHISTAFLVSDIPRVSGIKGLSWAPSRPNLPLMLDSDPDTLLLPYETNKSCSGHVSKSGLEAEWLACLFKAKDRIRDWIAQKMPLKSNGQLEVIKRSTRLVTHDQEKYTWYALLQASDHHGQPEPHRRCLDEDIFVIVGSYDGKTWSWLGLLRMDKGVGLPTLNMKKFLIA